MKKYSIKDLENYSGIKAHTIRIWEQRYNLLSPERTDTGIRYYSDDDVKKILTTIVLLKAGHKISKIADYSIEKIKAEIDKIEIEPNTSDSKIELSIQKLLTAGLAFDEFSLNNEYEKLKEYYPTKELITTIVYALLERIGVLWTKDDLTTLQEHFISNFVRQKILNEINVLPIPEKKEHDFVLFLPESETHEIGLLVANFSLRKANFSTLYLGQQVPIDNLIHLVNDYKIKKALGFIFISTGIEKLNEMLIELKKTCPETTFYWSGSIELFKTISFPKNHYLISSYPHSKKN